MLVGVYVADLANRGVRIGAGLVGTLAAISFGAELVGAVPLGMLSDAVSARALMTGGALLAALATLLFGVTHDTSVFVVSRALEGLAAAAGVPALLAYLTDATADNDVLRARAMSYFELSLLAGLALGGIVGSRLWAAFTRARLPRSRSCTSSPRCCSSSGASGSRSHRGRADVWQGLTRSLATPALRRLAPVWFCMNAIVGLWLGPTLYFLLTNRSDDSQMLVWPLRRRSIRTRLAALRVRAGVRHRSPGLEPRSCLGSTCVARLRVSLLAMLAVSAGLSCCSITWATNRLSFAGR